MQVAGRLCGPSFQSTIGPHCCARRQMAACWPQRRQAKAQCITMMLLQLCASPASGFVFMPVRLSPSRAAPSAAAAVPLSSSDTTDHDLLQSILDVAVAAAREGGALIREKGGAAVKETKYNPRDLVTEVDSAVQKIVERHVTEAFPDHGFLGEESVAPGPDASRRALEQMLKAEAAWTWIVDPIDGTTNFVHAMPLTAVSIGVAHRGVVQVGVIYDPSHDELFTSIRGQGAFLNDNQISVGQQGTIAEAMVATGSPTSIINQGPHLRGITALMPLVRSIRMIGSAAIVLAWIACGRITAYFVTDLNSWDTAAGSLIVEEAGGKMTSITTGEPYTIATRDILATNGRVHAELLQVLQFVNAGTPDRAPLTPASE